MKIGRNSSRSLAARTKAPRHDNKWPAVWLPLLPLLPLQLLACACWLPARRWKFQPQVEVLTSSNGRERLFVNAHIILLLRRAN